MNLYYKNPLCSFKIPTSERRTYRFPIIFLKLQIVLVRYHRNALPSTWNETLSPSLLVFSPQPLRLSFLQYHHLNYLGIHCEFIRLSMKIFRFRTHHGENDLQYLGCDVYQANIGRILIAKLNGTFLPPSEHRTSLPNANIGHEC